MVNDTVVRQSVVSQRGRGWKLALSAVFIAGLIWGGRWWWMDRRYKAAMEEIEAQVVYGQYTGACRKLVALLGWNSDPRGGIHYLLGSCEVARGRNKEADLAWAGVAPGSEFSERAIRGRMRLLHDAGKIAAAERLIIDAATDRRNDRTSLMSALVPIYIDLGRSDEAEKIIEARWEHLNSLGEAALEPALKLVLQHVDVTRRAPAVDAVRLLLEKAYELNRDDDRIWLGRANLAIRTGNHAEAERWLDICEKTRPADLAVERARLEWAMANDRATVVEKMLAERHELALGPIERLHVSAWLARRRGDTAAERADLEKLAGIDPFAPSALERLAELARQDGQPGRAAERLAKKAEFERLRARYLKLHDRKQPIRDAEELAQLAARLGRRFEERGFLVIAVGQEPGRADLKTRLEELGR